MVISEKNGSRWRLSGGRAAPRRGLSAPRAPIAVGISPLGLTFPPACSSKFLIANPRLEFRATRAKQRVATKSNRERIAISPFDFLVLLALHPSLATERSNRNIRFTGFQSTCSKQTTKQNSNRNKNGVSAISLFSARHRFLSPSLPPCLAATRLTRYNSGSHIEVNQP
jgi:hypothetical protein